MNITRGNRGSLFARIVFMLGWFGLAASAPATALPGVSSLPVSFQVENRNRSNVPCVADGRTYTIRGHLVGPTAALAPSAAPRPITVYLHGIGWGEFYWHLAALPAYDYASQMAALGHVSLVYDQLGYGASDRSPGLLTCYGSEAQIAQQIIDSLRRGTYTATGRTAAPTFTAVALASNQAAALVAEPYAYSFRDIDALIVTSFAEFPLAFKPAFVLQSTPYFASCALGGSRPDGATGPLFYEYFPLSEASFASINFANARPEVIARATALRGRSPCGEGLSAFTSIGLDTLQRLLRQIHIPVLIVNGLSDAIFVQPLGGYSQRALFTGSNDVSAEYIANAGQALPLERSAPDFRNVMHTWLAARGF